MALPFDPFYNIIDSEPCQTPGRPVMKIPQLRHNFQAFRSQQPLGPPELPPSFDPFSNSIRPTKVLHKELPSEKPSKSKPPNPSVLRPALDSSIRSIPSTLQTTLPSKNKRQQSKPSFSTSIAPATNRLRLLISNQLDSNLSTISTPSTLLTTLPKKIVRKRFDPSSLAHTVKSLRPLISSQPTNPSLSMLALNSSMILLPTTTPTILPSKTTR